MTASVPRLRLVAVAIAAVLGLVIAGKVTMAQTSDPEPDIFVYFKDASPLIKGNDVKAAGVKVGTIGSIEVEDGVAKVGLVLDDEVMPIHSDATVRVRPIGLLGERYIELDRGSPDAPVLAEGDDLPIKQSSRATDLDEVLDMVDAPTGSALSLLVTTLGEGLLGNGENAKRAIKALAPALLNTDRLAAILKDQNGVLAQLLDSVTPVAQQLAVGEGSRLDALLNATESTLDATTRNDSNLAGTLERLPETLREARVTLAALSGAAGATAPVLAALRPATDNLVQISRELQRFSRSARPALDGLDPVLDQADVLLDRARPVATALASLAPGMRSTAANGRVIATSALDNLSTILDFVRNWAMTTNGQDGLSHYFRAHVVVTSEILTGAIPTPDDGTPDTTNDTGTADPLAPLEGLLGSAGDLPLLGGLTSGLDGLLGGSGRSRAAEGGTATGLTSEQEESLLSSLIGGQ